MLDEAAAGVTTDEQGKKYEELLVYIFESVPGALMAANTRNYFGAEQIDLAVSHGGGFVGLPDKFIVECKNYAHPVDSKAVGYFLFICISRGAELAIVAAANGLSGEPDDMTYAHSLAFSASALGCRLIVITKEDLLTLNSTADLVEMLRRRYLNAWANAGIGIG